MLQLDENGDGVISYEEFVAQANLVFMFLSENRLRQAFDLFDLNEDGSIANFELQQVLTGGLKTIPEEDWDALIEKFDLDNDGQIDYEEFKNLMLHLYVEAAKIVKMR